MVYPADRGLSTAIRTCLGSPGRIVQVTVQATVRSRVRLAVQLAVHVAVLACSACDKSDYRAGYSACGKMRITVCVRLLSYLLR